jgi:hypothetical protein
VGGDDLPAAIDAVRLRETNERLALPADQILAAHLELEIQGGDVAAERQDFEPDAPLLDARS